MHGNAMFQHAFVLHSNIGSPFSSFCLDHRHDDDIVDDDH